MQERPICFAENSVEVRDSQGYADRDSMQGRENNQRWVEDGKQSRRLQLPFLPIDGNKAPIAQERRIYYIANHFHFCFAAERGEVSYLNVARDPSVFTCPRLGLERSYVFVAAGLHLQTFVKTIRFEKRRVPRRCVNHIHSRRTVESFGNDAGLLHRSHVERPA